MEAGGSDAVASRKGRESTWAGGLGHLALESRKPPTGRRLKLRSSRDIPKPIFTSGPVQDDSKQDLCHARASTQLTASSQGPLQMQLPTVEVYLCLCGPLCLRLLDFESASCPVAAVGAPSASRTLCFPIIFTPPLIRL